MLTERQIKLIKNVPKAENILQLESAIPWAVALKLAEKNHVRLPYDCVEDLRSWTKYERRKNAYEGYLYCNRIISAIGVYETDFVEMLLEIARSVRSQNVIYQEVQLMYFLHEERGIPLHVYLDACREGQRAALERHRVTLVFTIALSRERTPDGCLAFLHSMRRHLDIISGINLIGQDTPVSFADYAAVFQLAKEMGLHTSIDAGSLDAPAALIEAITLLPIDRIHDGLRCAESAELLGLLSERKILCAASLSHQLYLRNISTYEQHPLKELVERGIPCSINTRSPEYTCKLPYEYKNALEQSGLTNAELICCIRNAFCYSIKGQHLLPKADAFLKKWESSAG